MADYPLIDVRHLNKIYDNDGVITQVLFDINLKIKSGEFVSIMGPSGSGKSTLMHILGLLDRPTSGEYFFNGHNINELSDNQLANLRNQSIGFVFQSYNLIQQLTVAENIEIPLYYQDRPEAESRAVARELAARVGLADRLEHKPFELSGGQQQRVAIARALVNDPLVILADEPTGNLDSTSGAEILRLFDDLNAQGRTIIMVTHDLGVGQRSRRTIRLRDGEIESDSNPPGDFP